MANNKFKMFRKTSNTLKTSESEFLKRLVLDKQRKILKSSKWYLGYIERILLNNTYLVILKNPCFYHKFTTRMIIG